MTIEVNLENSFQKVDDQLYQVQNELIEELIMRREAKFNTQHIQQKSYMKKLSFKSPINRKSKIEPKLQKINSDEKDPEYLASEQIDSDSNTPANR